MWVSTVALTKLLLYSEKTKKQALKIELQQKLLTFWGRKSPLLFWPCCKQRLWRVQSPGWWGPVPWWGPWPHGWARTGPFLCQGGACLQGHGPLCRSWLQPPFELCNATEPVDEGKRRIEIKVIKKTHLEKKNYMEFQSLALKQSFKLLKQYKNDYNPFMQIDEK